MHQHEREALADLRLLITIALQLDDAGQGASASADAVRRDLRTALARAVAVIEIADGA